MSGRDGECRDVASELLLRVARYREVMGEREPFAPGLLRQTAPGHPWHHVDLAQPDPAARGQPSTQLVAGLPQLCSRDGVW